jgi:hypothetical protein
MNHAGPKQRGDPFNWTGSDKGTRTPSTRKCRGQSQCKGCFPMASIALRAEYCSGETITGYSLLWVREEGVTSQGAEKSEAKSEQLSWKQGH